MSDDMNFTQDSSFNDTSHGHQFKITLTCISTGGPATTVTWSRDSEIVSGGVTVLDDPVTAQYTHTLTDWETGRTVQMHCGQHQTISSLSTAICRR